MSHVSYEYRIQARKEKNRVTRTRPAALALLLPLFLLVAVCAAGAETAFAADAADAEPSFSRNTGQNISPNTGQNISQSNAGTLATPLEEDAPAVEAEVEGEVQYSKEQKTASLILIPNTFYTRNSEVGGLTGANLTVGEGESYGAGFMIVGNKRVNGWLTLSLSYAFDRIQYDGGIAAPGPKSTPAGVMSFGGHMDEDQDSHAVGFSAVADFGTYGRWTLGATQAFGFHSGTEQSETYRDGQLLATDTRGISQESRISSLSLIYERDVTAGNLRLTPWLHVGASYVVLEKMNAFGEMPGGGFYQPGDYRNSDSWSWSASTGMQANYRAGLYGFSAYAGYSRNLGSCGSPYYTVRSMGPGVVQKGYNIGADKDAFPVGAGISRVIPDVGVLSLNYKGMLSAHTQGHSLSVGLIVTF